jgi:hypothetical protein
LQCTLIITYVAKLREVCLNFVIADFWNESSDENLASSGLGLLRVDLLVVDNVIAGSDNLIDRIGGLVNDEGESTRATGCGVGLDIDAVDFAILTKVIAQLLCE